ncbi:MAG: ABC transporter substrate-binding protein [Chloroflexi bacterium]|nr:ABC transporter substrate-binding protein [Chloroflexota bacterium]
MTRLLLAVAFIVVGLMAVGCVQPPQPSPSSPPQQPAGALTPSPRQGWEEKWNGILAEARKEGSVRVYTLWGPQTRVDLTQAFNKKYGIDLEFLPFSRGAEQAARVHAEKNGGLFLADIFGSGIGTLIITMKPQGLLDPVRPMLILPEVVDPKAWRGGQLPFLDKEELVFVMLGGVIRTLVYNADMIKDGEITSYKDLLKPQYKGKIILNDPSQTGTGGTTTSYLSNTVWGETQTVDFLRKLIHEQDVTIQRDDRVLMESVARGKHAIGAGALPELLSDFMGMGAPIKPGDLVEDTRLTAGTGVLAVPKKFAHPNAGMVFLNWLLTREGQSVFAATFGLPSVRVDVSTEGMNPLFVPKPDKKYYFEDEAALAARAQWYEVARKVVAEPRK